MYNHRLNRDSPLGVTANNRSESRTQWNWNFSKTLIMIFKKNGQRHLVSAFKAPKYATKVWTIATAASSTKHQVERAKLSTQLGRHSILCVAFNVSIDETTVFELTSISFFLRRDFLLLLFAWVNFSAFQCTAFTNLYLSVLQNLQIIRGLISSRAG